MVINKKYKVTILGCGGSRGVPSIERGWGDCDPHNLKNYRTRCSAMIVISNDTSDHDFTILIDISPDFRHQALTHNIKKIDSILFTHYHADHILGIDELRCINTLMGKSIKCYSDFDTFKVIRNCFHYITISHEDHYQEKSQKYQGIYYISSLDFSSINPYQALHLNNGSIEIIPTVQSHNKIATIGYVIDNKIGYIPDFSAITQESISLFSNLDLLVVSVYSLRSHVAHMPFKEVIKLLDSLQPKKAIFTHMGVTMDYDTLTHKLLPSDSSILAGFDGLVISL